MPALALLAGQKNGLDDFNDADGLIHAENYFGMARHAPLAEVGHEVMGRRRSEEPPQFPAPASEMDDGAERDAGAIGGAAGIAQADVVELRAQCQMRQNA